MFVSKTVNFRDGNNKGLLQHVVKTGMQSNIILSASSIVNTDFVSLDSIFTEGASKYFCSGTNTANLTNYFLIEFVDRFVYPTGYVISSHPSVYIKSWMLEGSIDGKEWELLHSKYNSQDCATAYRWYRINKRGQYRFFKITQTGESIGNENYQKYSLRLSYLDFFGYMSNGQICTNNVNSYRRMKVSILFIVIIILKY